MNKWNWNSVYGRMGMVFLTASAVAVLVLVADSQKVPTTNKKGQSMIARNTYGKGNRDVELEVHVGKLKEPLTIQVKEQKYRVDELPELFTKAGKRLEKSILGKNERLEDVRHDLNLIEQIPDMGIHVSWEVDNYDVMNICGELQEENLKKEGTVVQLTAILSYGEEEAVHTFSAHVFPLAQTKKEKRLHEVNELVRKADLETEEKKMLVLPDNINGEAVAWKYPKENRAAGLFLLGAVGAGGVYMLDKEKKKQMLTRRKQELMSQYPLLISQLTLFLGAGMTVRNAWFKMVQEYERQKNQRGQRAVYEEMSYTMHEMQGGVSEGECYEHFGARCGLPTYRKLGVLLAQNLRKGTKGITDLLKRESAEAFEDRKKLARRLGEEAGTKLLGPMFLMLAVVLIIIIVPAFFSIQI